jgi:phenol hydroxylase P3 protein
MSTRPSRVGVQEATQQNIKDQYKDFTRDLGWEPSYVPKEEMYPPEHAEGVHFSDWDKFDDPFRLFYKDYVKVQEKKEESLHMVFDHAARYDYLSRVEATWLEGMKLFACGQGQTEYETCKDHMAIARYSPAPALRAASLYQSIDELRHAQNYAHYLRYANRKLPGFSGWATLFQNHWLYQGIRHCFEDILTANPFEAIIAANVVLEIGFTNLNFVALPAVGAANYEYAWSQLQLTTQSDETRHMAIGQSMMRTLLEEDSRNLPIIQGWLDKWTWRLYRVDALGGSIFFDYFAKNKVMSYKEAFQKYFVDDFIGGLVADLGPYGIKEPAYLEYMLDDMDQLSHVVWKYLYQRKDMLWFKMFQPDDEDREWLTEKYPDWPQLVGRFWDDVAGGRDVANAGLVPVCNLCQVACMFQDEHGPMIEGPVELDGRTYWFCSRPCREIFMNEPEKYKGGKTIVDLVLDGAMPDDPDEFLKLLGINEPGLGGDLFAPGGANGQNGHGH